MVLSIDMFSSPNKRFVSLVEKIFTCKNVLDNAPMKEDGAGARDICSFRFISEIWSTNRDSFSRLSSVRYDSLSIEAMLRLMELYVSGNSSIAAVALSKSPSFLVMYKPLKAISSSDEATSIKNFLISFVALARLYGATQSIWFLPNVYQVGTFRAENIFFRLEAGVCPVSM